MPTPLTPSALPRENDASDDGTHRGSWAAHSSCPCPSPGVSVTPSCPVSGDRVRIWPQLPRTPFCSSPSPDVVAT